MNEKAFLKNILNHLADAMKLATLKDFDKMAVQMSIVAGKLFGRIGALPEEKP